LINDDITISVFHTYLLTILDGNYSMLLDGYPRSLEQAKDLLQMAIKYERPML